MNISNTKGILTLSNGVKIPYLGLGTWKSQDGQEVIQAVKWALELGYRHIDTAAIYQNERGVGEGIRQSGIPLKEIFVTTKVWNGDQGFESTLSACEQSLKKLGLDSIDLYLVHWPVKGKFKETWKAMEKLYNEGMVRSIGVSNFLRHHLEDLMETCAIKPMVNQLEFHPWLVQQDLVDFCADHDIQYEAWSPIMQGRVGELKSLEPVAQKYGKTLAQIVLRWNLQKGIVTIPKSVNFERIRENQDLFDFELTTDEISRIDQLDRHFRLGPDPDNFDF